MHVNLSPHQLHDSTIVATVREALGDAGLAAELLVLEVTEGSLLADHAAVARLHELRALGVQIAIDDFDTGYTSISYLQQLPVQILKIDRSFVSGGNLGADERRAFLAAIVGLAKACNCVRSPKASRISNNSRSCGPSAARPARASGVRRSRGSPTPVRPSNESSDWHRPQRQHDPGDWDFVPVSALT